MKKLIIIFITIVLSTQAIAQQHWSAGFRIGGRFDNLYYYVDETKVNFEPSVFITRRVNKRLHAEIGISYFRLNQDPYKHFDPHYIDFLDRKETVLFTNIGAKYDVVLKKKLTIYASAGFVNMHYFYRLADNQGSAEPYIEAEGSHHSMAYTFYIGAGANYNINSKFFVNANSRIEVLRDKLTGANTLMNWTPSVIPVVQIGLGYKF